MLTWFLCSTAPALNIWIPVTSVYVRFISIDLSFSFIVPRIVEARESRLWLFLPAKYFFDIANYLVAKGYVRDVSIRGAPYDFRKAPSEKYHSRTSEC